MSHYGLYVVWLQAPGKGSLWTVDPLNRISLLQALKKTHHQSFEQYISEKSTITRRRSRLEILFDVVALSEYLFCLSI